MHWIRRRGLVLRRVSECIKCISKRGKEERKREKEHEREKGRTVKLANL